MLISPFSSVLYILVPFSFSLCITSLLGCPKLLFFPTPIKATLGFIAFKNSPVVEVLEPWCATFNTSAFKFIFFLNISYSAYISMSPVNSIEKELYSTLHTIELLFIGLFIISLFSGCIIDIFIPPIFNTSPSFT